MAKRVSPLSDSWLDGFPERLEVAEPVTVAQRVLDGWTEDRCQRVWAEVRAAVERYREDPLLKDRLDRANAFTWYDSDALAPGQPLANPSDFFGLLLDAVTGGHRALKPVVQAHGLAAILAISVLAVAADLPGDDPPDLEHGDWIRAAVISCWRGGFYLQRAGRADRTPSNQELQSHLKRARSELGRIAARGRHSARDKVFEEAMRLYEKMDPELSAAEAARRIWRNISNYAEEVGYKPFASNPSDTICRWIRAHRKNS